MSKFAPSCALAALVAAWPMSQAAGQTALAPDPTMTPEAVVQIYDTGWHGGIGAYCWVAVKPAGAADYTTYEVIGSNFHRDRDVVPGWSRPREREWFQNLPHVLAELRGDAAEAAIQRIKIEATRGLYPERDYTGPRVAWLPNDDPGASFSGWVAKIAPNCQIRTLRGPYYRSP